MFVELHIIQNFSPSNLNRDDTNNPKDCNFGGVRRARISSQCIKRAIRREPAFADTTGVDPSDRTRLMATGSLLPLLIEAGKPEEEAQLVAVGLAEVLTGGLDKEGKRTNVLFYLSKDEASALAQAALDNWEAILNGLCQEKPDTKPLDDLVKEFVKQAKDRCSAPDVAMFGRMLAIKPDLNIDAACQVSHAISTHRVSMEMDFYTAVDDLQPGGETGAGMMGMTGFNSATFYRYARIDWEQLVHNLQGNTALAQSTVEGFLRAAVRAIPTGKQNAFAAQNPPSFLLAVVRDDGMSWSLANAFEKPVYPDRDYGLVGASILALDRYWGELEQAYGGAGKTAAALSLHNDLPLEWLSGYSRGNLEEWLGTILAALPQEYAS
jgi:CRISPR system Cascade subunit CasC